MGSTSRFLSSKSSLSRFPPAPAWALPTGWCSHQETTTCSGAVSSTAHLLRHGAPLPPWCFLCFFSRFFPLLLLPHLSSLFCPLLRTLPQRQGRSCALAEPAQTGWNRPSLARGSPTSPYRDPCSRCLGTDSQDPPLQHSCDIQHHFASGNQSPLKLHMPAPRHPPRFPRHPTESLLPFKKAKTPHQKHRSKLHLSLSQY